MPWHAKPNPDNLRVTFKLWQKRKHPASCKTCATIWGKKGAPRSFEDYMVCYPPLAHGAKRHLTRSWSPGLTIREVAALSGCSTLRVCRAIANGALNSSLYGRCRYVSRTDTTLWRARKCTTGEHDRSWISLATARKWYMFTLPELRCFIVSRRLKSKIGTFGAMRGVVYVSRHQCGQLREKIGFTERQAARRAGVSVARMRTLLRGVDWRKAAGIPLWTVKAAIKRLWSRQGYTIAEAARAVGMPVQWVRARKLDGTIKVSRAKWDRRRVYITEPMLQRLRDAKRKPVKRERFNAEWVHVSDAANEAAVSICTIVKWAKNKELDRRRSRTGWRYHRRSVRTCARSYWRTVRFHRATPPAWLRVEPKKETA